MDIINQVDHPIGTRLLITLQFVWVDADSQPTIHEVTVAEWSPGGLVKLCFGDPDAEDGYGRWQRPQVVHIVEQL